MRIDLLTLALLAVVVLYTLVGISLGRLWERKYGDKYPNKKP